jgi:hypothetical protein
MHFKFHPVMIFHYQTRAGILDIVSYGIDCGADEANRALTNLCADGAAINNKMCNDPTLNAVYQWCVAHLLQKAVEDALHGDVVVTGVITKLRGAMHHVRVSGNRAHMAAEYAAL